MDWSLVAYFFGGALLANGVPHYVSGVLGRAFQSPFARPPGKGYSSSYVNVLWGMFNWGIAYFLVLKIGTFDVHNNLHFGLLIAGAGIGGLILAKAFGDIHGGTNPPKQ